MLVHVVVVKSAGRVHSITFTIGRKGGVKKKKKEKKETYSSTLRARP